MTPIIVDFERKIKGNVFNFFKVTKLLIRYVFIIILAMSRLRIAMYKLSNSVICGCSVVGYTKVRNGIFKSNFLQKVKVTKTQLIYLCQRPEPELLRDQGA